MSDIWGTIFIGKRWVEDDGSQKCRIDQAREIQVTVGDFFPAESGFQFSFASAKTELLHLIDEQLEVIKEIMMRKALERLEVIKKDVKDTLNRDENETMG